MVTQNVLVVTWASSLLIVLLSHQTSQAKTHDCRPSSCGIVSNISSPFRLKDDPKHCGYPRFELACEENVTFIYLYSHMYRVKAIDYNNSTMWLADASITNSTCSFPNHSLYLDHNQNGYFSMTFDPWSRLFLKWPINFMSCPYPLKNSSLFTEVTHCNTSHSPDRSYSYVKVGHMNASEVRHMCSVDIIVFTSWKFGDLNNVSLSEIHDSLLYGFEMKFYYPYTLSVVYTIFTVSAWLLIGAIIIGLLVPAGSLAAVIYLVFYINAAYPEYYRSLEQFASFIGALLIYVAVENLSCNC